MADPAKLLHTQLTEWSIKEPLSKARGLTEDSGWEKQRVSVINLDHVMTLLNRLDDEGTETSAWRKYTVPLHRAVFGFGTDWELFNNRQNRVPNPVDEHALNSLLSLSAVIRHLVPELDEGGTQSLQDMLTDDVLKQPSEEFPYELRAYFIRVRDHLKWCVTHFDEVGEFELHEAAMQFKMTVLFMTAVAPQRESTKWQTFMKDKFVWPFVTTTVTAQPAAWAQNQIVEFGLRILESTTGG